MSRIQDAMDFHANRRETESRNAAARAIHDGCAANAVMVTYPAGLQMVRYAEPFKDYGMYYEIEPDIWAELVQIASN